MRFGRLGVVFLALLGAPRAADADLLARVIAAAGGQQPGGGAPGQPMPQPSPQPQQQAQPPPEQSDDLTAWAGAARTTTLPELLQQAVRTAPSLATARLDIAIAEARIYQTYARDDWRLDAKLTVNSSQSYFSGVGQIERSTNGRLTAGLSRSLSTGGIVTVGAITTYDRSPSFIDPSVTEVNWADSVTGSITQPLLRGRGRLLYDAPERRATLSRDAAVLERRLAAIQSVQALIAAYWDLVLAEQQVAITRSSLELAKERLRITQIGSDGGKVPRSEIPAVQQIIATREEDVLNGELAVLDRSIALRRTAGLPVGKGELGLRVGAELEPRDVAWDLGELTERAFAASPELAQLGKQDASLKIDIEVTENGLLPQLDAALTLGPTGQDGNFGTAWKNMFSSPALASGSLMPLIFSLRPLRRTTAP